MLCLWNDPYQTHSTKTDWLVLTEHTYSMWIINAGKSHNATKKEITKPDGFEINEVSNEIILKKCAIF